MPPLGLCYKGRCCLEKKVGLVSSFSSLSYLSLVGGGAIGRFFLTEVAGVPVN